MFFRFGLGVVLWLCTPHAALALERPVVSLNAEWTALQGSSSSRTRQTLTNYHDLQYVTHLSVGQQTLTGIIDTGSFELVVFSKECKTCGKAARYDTNFSSSYRMGALTNRQRYGSGDTFSRQAHDFVAMRSGAPVNQSFWEVTRAQMPLLANAEFQAIIGVGPPETPAADAWASVDSVVQIIKRSLASGELPPAATEKRLKNGAEVAGQMSHSPPMLSTMGVGAFSVCLGAHPGADGFLTWNDTLANERPSLFTRIPVIGRHTWTLNLTGVHLAEPLRLADQPLLSDAPRPSHTYLDCAGGCGAIVDSGTSMLVMPSVAIEALSQAVERMNDNCSNLHELPDLVFDFGGTKVHLPPDAYVAEVLGEVPSYLEGFAQVRRLRREGSRCDLLVMESSSDTNYGPLWILGMPFFRTYYTSFQVGRSSAERAIHITPGGEDCMPGGDGRMYSFLLKGSGGGRHSRVRRIDPSKIFVSHNAWRASTSSFVML